MKKLLLTIIVLLSFAPPLANADITSNLVGWWKLDDGSGTTAVDSGSGAQNGTLLGASLPTWITGKIGPYAINVPNSAASRVEIPNDVSNQITGAKTISCWFRADTSTHNLQGCLSKWDSIGGYYLGFSYLTDNHFMALFRNDVCSGNRFAESVSTYNDNAWHHAVSVWAPNTDIILYIDGNAEIVTGNGSESATSCNNTADKLQIGNFTTTGAPFRGDIDDVRLYSRALSAADVLELYAYPPVSAVNFHSLIVRLGRTFKVLLGRTFISK